MDPQDILGVPEFLCPSAMKSLRVCDTRNNAILEDLPDLTNEVIDNGQLRIRKLLGCGRKGACYEAESTASEGELFAVKAIPRRKLDAIRRRRVDREIKLHQRLSEGCSSRNVLPLYRTCIDEENDIVFLITELCPEGDLQSAIAGGSFQGDDDKIKTTFLQIIDAVHALHELGISHCDLKPQNIFMRRCGAPVVGDFGLSTEEEISQKFGFGTVPYMSSELVQSINPTLLSHSTRRADIWALGVILFNMVTGKYSWGAASIEDDQFRDYVLSPYDFLSRRFDITQEANEIFRSCFTLDPSKRTSLRQLRKRVDQIESFGSGMEKLPMQRENTHLLRLDLTLLPPSRTGLPYYQQSEDRTPSPSTVDSSCSPTCLKRRRRRNVVAKTPEPMRIPRRRKTLAVFEIADERDISDMTQTSKSVDSYGPTTPKFDGLKVIPAAAVVLNKMMASMDITEETMTTALI